MSIFICLLFMNVYFFKSLSRPMSTFCYVLFHYPHYSTNLSFCQEKFTVQISFKNNIFQNKISHIILTMSHIIQFSTRQIKIKFYSLKSLLLVSLFSDSLFVSLFYIYHANSDVFFHRYLKTLKIASNFYIVVFFLKTSFSPVISRLLRTFHFF